MAPSKEELKHKIPKRSLKIIDATLSEGCQASSVHFTNDQSVEIANDLLSLGVDMIECGYPIMSRYEMERVKKITNLIKVCPVLTVASPNRSHIRAAADSGARWVGIFLGINDVSQRKNSSRLSRRQLLDVIMDAIIYAHKCGLCVRYTIEDASRSKFSLI